MPRLYRCFFFIFITRFCIGFTRTEKKYVKVFDIDIYKRVRKLKTKHETIKMNMNSIMLTKIWRDKYIHEHHAYEKKNKKNRWICECGDLSAINLMSFKMRKCVVE